MSFAPRGSQPLLPANVVPRAPPGMKPATSPSHRVAFREAVTANAAMGSTPTTAQQRGGGGGGGGEGSRIIDHYVLASQLHASMSSGTEVHSAKHRMTGETVTMKAVDRANLAAAGRVPITHSTPLYAQLEHEHIARLHEVFDSHRFVQVQEWVPGAPRHARMPPPCPATLRMHEARCMQTHACTA